MITPDELLKILADYKRAGWVILAVPADMAKGLVDREVTQESMLELSHRIAADRHELAYLRTETGRTASGEGEASDERPDD